jgi:hypothetical protein
VTVRLADALRLPTLRDGELHLDQVDAVHELGDRVLDLEPGVHLQEEEPVELRVVEELDRAGTAVVDRAGGLAGSVVEGAPGRSAGAARRLLDHLLVAALERAVALAEHEHAVPVPTTCTSTWRPRSTYGSTKTVPSPNADAPRPRRGRPRRQRRRASRTTRMPRPPPPADAFTSSGRSASVGLGGRSSTGTPAAHQLLGRDLRAHRLDRLGRGPTQVSPASMTARAKSAFSDRKP